MFIYAYGRIRILRFMKSNFFFFLKNILCFQVLNFLKEILIHQNLISYTSLWYAIARYHSVAHELTTILCNLGL